MLTELLDQRRLDHAAMALTVVAVYDPSGLGRVLRNEAGGVERVVEEKDATDEERETPRDQRRALRVRRRVAPRRGSTTLIPSRDDRRAVPHAPRRSSPGRTAGSSPRSMSTTKAG